MNLPSFILNFFKNQYFINKSILLCSSNKNICEVNKLFRIQKKPRIRPLFSLTNPTALVAFMLLLAAIFFCQCKYEKEDIVFSLENNRFRKEFIASRNSPAPITINIFEPDKNVPLTNPSAYFQFYLNNQKISSLDKIWQYTGHDQRLMGNDGTEYILKFEATKGEMKGLKLAIYQQFFPGSTLVREKLVLSTEKDHKFTLNKAGGQNLFDYPCYQVKTESGDNLKSCEIRIAGWELKPTTFGENPKGNHMFYPDIIEKDVTTSGNIHKGPVSIITDGQMGWFMAYEHASQDNTNGLFDEIKRLDSQFVVDAMQGTEGVFNFSVSDKDFWFLGIKNRYLDNAFETKIKALRGAYYDGEVIDEENPYSSVWTATAFYPGGNIEDGRKVLRDYLLYQICENPASREPEYYYNTWGMQRTAPKGMLRNILTYERIFEEIEYAAELGVDIFVLDDGWEQTQGIWTPNKERLPNGLAPVKQKLDEYGMKMGLWLSPMGIDSTTQRFKDHQEWVIKDSEGNPILAQWHHPAFDFVSGFYDVFIDDCKKLIDQGCRFMKWDAINTFYSSLPNLEHGDSTVSEEERRARYEYLLPVYVTRAMEELTNYEPELVIEVDLTEARRVMAGLAPVSQGKLFWMNNGASWYNDYSTYRTKSMRTIANEFAGIIPLELFTYANYPHNLEGALRYNVTNSILAGKGFWGNLSLMSSEEREKVGRMVEQAKQTESYLFGINCQVNGKVGDSPEIYKVINDSVGAGQIIGFSSRPVNYNYRTALDYNNVLAVLNAVYKFADDSLILEMEFGKPESSFLSFIVPNKNLPVSIVAADTPITKANLLPEGIEYEVDEKGTQIIHWGASLGEPDVFSEDKVVTGISMSESEFFFIIRVETTVKGQIIRISNH